MHPGWSNKSIDAHLYIYMPQYFPNDNKAGRLPTRTSGHKVYMSSKDVLNGDWVQIVGDGAEIDAKTTRLFEFLDHTQFHGDLTAIDQSEAEFGPQSFNYTIKTQWE